LFNFFRETTNTKWAAPGGMNDFSSLSDPAVRTIQTERVDGGRPRNIFSSVCFSE